MQKVKKHILWQCGFSIISVFGVATFGFFISGIFGYKVIAYLFLLLVSILSMFLDILPVFLAAIMSALVWDFFFIPPIFTFTVGTTEDRLMLMMYFIIASVNGVLTYKIRKIKKQAHIKEEKENAIKLYNTLFSSLSHELRTPIATIIGATDILKESSAKLTLNNKNELLNEILIASLRLNEQIDNLLNMSRLEYGYLQIKKDWCDINELVNSVVNKLADRKGDHEIIITVPSNFPYFKLDYGLMQQVLYNLINNAIIYTPANSKIYISASCIKTYKLVIIIADNGKGFPVNEIGFVFDKFYRLKNSFTGGTGLGLSIVKGYVEAHNGKILLENIPNSGAKFTIEIPTESSQLPVND